MLTFAACRPLRLPWADFRGKVLGPTDPASAPAESIRGMIMSDWKELGLKTEPTTGDNGVHASASPLEGLGERANWLKMPLEKDDFATARARLRPPAPACAIPSRTTRDSARIQPV